MEDWNTLHKCYDANFKRMRWAYERGDKRAHKKYCKIERELEHKSNVMYRVLGQELKGEGIKCIHSATL